MPEVLKPTLINLFPPARVEITKNREKISISSKEKPPIIYYRCQFIKPAPILSGAEPSRATPTTLKFALSIYWAAEPISLATSSLSLSLSQSRRRMQAARRCHYSRRRATGWLDPASAAGGVAGSGISSRRGWLDPASAAGGVAGSDVSICSRGGSALTAGMVQRQRRWAPSSASYRGSGGRHPRWATIAAGLARAWVDPVTTGAILGELQWRACNGEVLKSVICIICLWFCSCLVMVDVDSCGSVVDLQSRCVDCLGIIHCISCMHEFGGLELGIYRGYACSMHWLDSMHRAVFFFLLMCVSKVPVVESSPIT